MKGRGNASWLSPKKSFEIKLSSDVSFLNMQKSDNWALLGNTYDPTGIHNKMAYDVSAEYGMEYSIESDWIDVYIDGAYWGCYLLCHEPDIGKNDLNIINLKKENNEYNKTAKKYDDGESKGYILEHNPIDISGGYLIEVDNYSPKRACGFYLPDDVFFHIKAPDNASKEQIAYIQSYIKDIDDEIKMKYSCMSIDCYSFARQYLINEILSNHDAYVGSTFFYKKRGDDILYAGPCWDYDGLGLQDEQGTVYDNDWYYDYYRPILEWNEILIDNNTEYRDYIKDTYKDNTWIWNNLLSFQIDKYYDKISASMYMDYARWGKTEEEVLNYKRPVPEDSISLFKLSLYKRLCTLSAKWDVDCSYTYPQSDV